MNKSKLNPLPCPFCGCQDIRLHKEDAYKFNNTNEYTYWMECEKCCAQSTPEAVTIDALDAWNQRA